MERIQGHGNPAHPARQPGHTHTRIPESAPRTKRNPESATTSPANHGSGSELRPQWMAVRSSGTGSTPDTATKATPRIATNATRNANRQYLRNPPTTAGSADISGGSVGALAPALGMVVPWICGLVTAALRTGRYGFDVHPCALGRVGANVP